MSAACKGSDVPSTSIEVAVELATLEPCDLRRAPLAASVLEVPLRFGIVMKRHGLRTWVGHAIHASVSRETARPRRSSRARQTLRSEGLRGAMTCRHARPEAPVRHPSGCCRSGLGQAEGLDRCEDGMRSIGAPRRRGRAHAMARLPCLAVDVPVLSNLHPESVS